MLGERVSLFFSRHFCWWEDTVHSRGERGCQRKRNKNYVHISLTCLRTCIFISSELSERKEFSSTIFLSSLSWLVGLRIKLPSDRFAGRNQIKVVGHVYMEATQENWVAHQNGQSLYLKYCLQLETKEDVEGSGLGLQRSRREFAWRWKNKCFINWYLLGLVESVVQSGLGSLGFACICLTTPSRLSLQMSTALYLVFFRQSGGRSKILESFGSWLFSAGNNPHAKETFWGAGGSNIATLQSQSEG